MFTPDMKVQELIDTLQAHVAQTQNSLIEKIREELPKHIDMITAIKTHSDVGAGYTIGHNAATKEVRAILDKYKESI